MLSIHAVTQAHISSYVCKQASKRAHACTHARTHARTHALAADWLARSLPLSLSPSLARSPAHTPTHSITHSPTHSCTHWKAMADRDWDRVGMFVISFQCGSFLCESLPASTVVDRAQIARTSTIAETDDIRPNEPNPLLAESSHSQCQCCSLYNSTLSVVCPVYWLIVLAQYRLYRCRNNDTR